MMRTSLAIMGRRVILQRLPLTDWTLTPCYAKVHCSSTNMDAASAYLKKHEITVSDEDAPGPVLSFDASGLPSHLLDKLTKDFSSPTPIQAQGLPIVMSGRNLVGIAQTGSGKTLAFLLPALMHIAKMREEGHAKPNKGPSVLIMAPTRELAKQIEEVAAAFRRIAKFRSVCCIGGEARSRQLRQYDEGAQLMIGTPGRINDFLETGDISLENCNYVVVDEADRMLDMGFEPQVRSILDEVSKERQTVMFSATWPEEVQELAREFLDDYTFMNVGSIELSANRNITQKVNVCPVNYKQEAFLNDMEGEMMDKKILVFTEMKVTVDRIERMLRNRRISAVGIHGDKSQMQRDTTIRRFKEGACKVMIATDVAARGLDIQDVEYVVNYDFPRDIENYIHRIGRTGRADKKGTSITYMTPDDATFASKLIKILEEAEQEVSPELVELVEVGKYAKKVVKGRKSYGQQQHRRRDYSYDLGGGDEEGYRPRRNQDRWGSSGGKRFNYGGRRNSGDSYNRDSRTRDPYSDWD